MRSVVAMSHCVYAVAARSSWRRSTTSSSRAGACSSGDGGVAAAQAQPGAAEPEGRHSAAGLDGAGALCPRLHGLAGEAAGATTGPCFGKMLADLCKGAAEARRTRRRRSTRIAAGILASRGSELLMLALRSTQLSPVWTAMGRPTARTGTAARRCAAQDRDTPPESAELASACRLPSRQAQSPPLNPERSPIQVARSSYAWIVNPEACSNATMGPISFLSTGDCIRLQRSRYRCTIAAIFPPAAVGCRRKIGRSTAIASLCDAIAGTLSAAASSRSETDSTAT